jgi:hypothetical protein
MASRVHYQVFDTERGLTCGVVESWGCRFWVTRQGDTPFAFGHFVCAAKDRETADQIAAALNQQQEEPNI